MTFVQVEFVLLFAAVFALYWMLPRRWMQNALLVLVSALFYGWVHPWFLFLLYGSAVLDYAMALAMRKWPDRRRWFLALSMAGNLGMLGWFKYADFFIENFVAAFDAMGVQTSLHTMGIFLPVGISFYTFQTMSYSIDVYRGQLEPRRNFLDYVTFVSFFPQLVAGPVERAQNLLVQVETDRQLQLALVRSGLTLALWGGLKKVMCADLIAPYVDQVYMMTSPSWPLVWAATLGFAIQILADFSAYTDIARGVARMLGFELVENFDHPYLARNPSDFWRRWHISFSTWIRDYVYIPLGGSRGGRWGTLRSTFGAMVLSGLWHGAAWSFVFWGAFHAVLLTGYRLVTPRIPRSVRDRRVGPVPVGDIGAIGLMFCFTLFSWMLFRETRFDRVLLVLSLSPLDATAEEWAATAVLLGICALAAAPMVLALLWERVVAPRLSTSHWRLPVHTTAWAIATVGILVFYRRTGGDFIYFQF
ncbi:MAG: MBOAT family protein [Alphaproteobacteria bacterium]|nr:MBOAT family protein [Alphaproteobacteria bacterium]